MIGANPSRCELLYQKQVNKIDSKKANHEKAYLQSKRFYHLTKEESYESILNSK